MNTTYKVEFCAGYEPIVRYWEATSLDTIRGRAMRYLASTGGEAYIYTLDGDFVASVEVEY